MEVIPGSFFEFLNKWELKILIVLSLTSQILLITLGHRRKYVCRIWIRIVLWCAYLFADWVAIVSIGIISKNTLDECEKGENVEDNQLVWFWAQFLLLHLGGSDTITAYSVEDNELWLRHLSGMVIQTGLAFYILLVALPGSSRLPVLSILIFVAGLIKCGERMFALWSANSENFRDSMLTEPDPGPNYPKFMEEYTLKKAEGFCVEAAEVIETPVNDHRSFSHGRGELICGAYDLFSTFKCLFADAILSFQDRDKSKSYFQELSCEQAFEIVEIELGFMFDELYTKASVVYKVGGIVLRLITFSFTLFSLMAFPFLSDESNYKKLDLIVTYLLLAVAVWLEIYAVWVVINSDWARNWLSRRERTTNSPRIIQWFQQPNKKRWSKRMSQHNLLDLCVGDKAAVWSRFYIPRLIKIDKYLEKHWYKTFIDVSPALKHLIFGELQSYTRINHSDPTTLWTRRGSFTLERYADLSLDWVNEGEFDKNIILWHIATDICYSNQQSSDPSCVGSKQISDYMLHLLIAYPFMLPIGIGMIRFRDTCAEAQEFLEERKVKSNKDGACVKLLQVNTQVPPAKVKGDRSKSVLFDACKLAKLLLAQEHKTWEIISKVWVEMLAYAATHCGGNDHARQLRKGGELLTHVWLLMAHLGITEQFQISQGHARAKLIVK